MSTESLDFFEPGHTYTRNLPFAAPEVCPSFRCVAVAEHPTRGTRRALGFERQGANAPWASSSLRDKEWADGWVDVTEPVEVATTSAHDRVFHAIDRRDYTDREALGLVGEHTAEVLREAAAVADTYTERFADMDAMAGAIGDELRHRAAEAEKDTQSGCDEWVRCSRSHCPNTEQFAKAPEHGWQHCHMDTWRCPQHAGTTEAGDAR